MTGEALHFKQLISGFVFPDNPPKRSGRRRQHQCDLYSLRSKDGPRSITIVRWRRYVKFVVITSFTQMRISTCMSVARMFSSNMKACLLAQEVVIGKIIVKMPVCRDVVFG